MMDPVRRLDRRLAFVVFALLFASYAYFYQGGGWNENSRMDLVRALVEDHSLAIDRFHMNTGDKAKLGEHYYSDKAPGLSLLAVPAYALVRLFGARLGEHSFVVLASYVVTTLTVGLATALLGALLYRASRRLGATPRGALLAALGYGLGTTAFPFATLFFGHQMAAFLAFAAFSLAWSCRDRHSDPRSFAAGALAGLALVTEFPLAPVVGILFWYHADARHRARRLVTFAAGLALVLLPLALYSTAAFGSPWRTGYSVLADAGSRHEMLGRGTFGLGLPSLGVFVELMIGRYRGLFPYSPLLFLALAGFAFGLGLLSTAPPEERRPHPQRRELWAALAVVVYFVLFVSSYTWWHGGASFGARHLLPMLPFLCLPLGLVADLRPRLALGLGIVSVIVMTMVTAVQPKPGEWVNDPFFSKIAPAFFRGELAAGKSCPLVGNTDERHVPLLRNATNDAFNLGMVLGGRHRLPTLLPLLALWVSVVFELRRATARPATEPEPAPESG